MSVKSAAAVVPLRKDEKAASIVEKYLAASMIPDPVAAARYIADDLKLTFTGGRKMSHPRDSAAFNAKRYKWVKKKIERSSTTWERFTANGQMVRLLKATVMSTASWCATERSCRWTSGTTAPSASSFATASKRKARYRRLMLALAFPLNSYRETMRMPRP